MPFTPELVALYLLNLNKTKSQILNPKLTDYKIEYISFSENEILFIERIEDTLFSLERKVYHFKILRLDSRNFLQESSIDISLTTLPDAEGLTFERGNNQNIKLKLGGKKISSK